MIAFAHRPGKAPMPHPSDRVIVYDLAEERRKRDAEPTKRQSVYIGHLFPRRIDAPTDEPPRAA